LFDCITNVMADTLDVGDGQNNGTSGTLYDKTDGRKPVMSFTNADPRKGLRILVAEDNAVNQKVAVRMLEKLGYRAGVASNGVEAVAAVSLVPYDIVFMDCQMPEMDGFEATAEIQKLDGVDRHTIIIAMTANALQGDREKCLAAGMDDYVSKPVRQEDLASAIDRWSLAREIVGHQSPEHKDADLLLDESVLQEVSQLDDDDNPGLLNQLINIFIHETPRRIEHIREALRLGDLHGVSGTSHVIRGGSSQLGLVGMTNVCLRLEDRAEAGAPVECVGIIAELKQVFSDTMQLLESRSQVKV
jgi:CheY-like chemotaxis protein/HPt (histidine-containing phosphotransfer) domain-containing protein